MSDTLSKMADSVFEATKGFVLRALDPVIGRIKALEERVPVAGKDGTDGKDGRDGVDGRDGKDVSPEDVVSLVAESVRSIAEKMPVPKDGKDGRDGVDGKDGTSGVDGKNGVDGVNGKDGANGRDGEKGADGIDGKDGANGVDGKDGSPGQDGQKGADGINGRDGKDGSDGINGKDGADGINGKDGSDGIAGKDGQSVDMAEVRLMLRELVVAAVKEMPAPKDGRDGKDFDPAAFDAAVLRAVSSIPAPKDGKDGKDGRDGEKGIDGRDGREGEPGRDALQIDVLDGIDETKRYQRNTFASYRGGLIRSFRATDPVTTDGLEKAGWVVLLDGDADEEMDSAERSWTMRRVKTSGRVIEKTVILPTLIDRGSYTSGKSYEKGDVVTYGGGMWIAQQDTDVSPGDSKGEWRLAVKRGRDAATRGFGSDPK